MAHDCCGATGRKHLDGCPSSLTGYRKATGTRCNHRWSTAAVRSHYQHACRLTNVGGRPHPGSHVCGSAGCSETK
jgi:hypothetical protein